MLNRKVTAVYFSATGTNRTSVCAIASGLSKQYRELDLTGFDAGSQEITFGKDDILVIGAPVYSGRIYKGAARRFTCLKGDHTPCVVTVTYGNRHYDDALLELFDQMKSQGFCPVAAAALIGEHTFGEIQVGRPNSRDQDEDKNFALNVAAKLETEGADLERMTDFVLPGSRPYMDGGSGGGFRPLTSAACTLCGLCVKACPEQAIAQDCKTIDSEKCISCFRCIRSCPQKAKNMETPDYNGFAVEFSARLAKARPNEYFM